MFKLVLDDSNILKTSFKAISSIVDEVQIQADENGLKLNSLSRDHITFIHLELKISLFDEYLCDEQVNINVSRNRCLYCREHGAPDNCIYAKREPEQATLGRFPDE